MCSIHTYTVTVYSFLKALPVGAEVNKSVAYIASVSVRLRSKERPRNGTGTVFCPRKIGARAKIRKRGWGRGRNHNLPLPSLFSRGNSLPLNPTETLATQANKSVTVQVGAEHEVMCDVFQR